MQPRSRARSLLGLVSLLIDCRGQGKIQGPVVMGANLLDIFESFRKGRLRLRPSCLLPTRIGAIRRSAAVEVGIMCAFPSKERRSRANAGISAREIERL